MHAAEFQLLSHGRFGLLAVQFLSGVDIRNEPCQPVEFRHDLLVPFAHGGEGKRYRIAGLNLLPAIVTHGSIPAGGRIVR